MDSDSDSDMGTRLDELPGASSSSGDEFPGPGGFPPQQRHHGGGQRQYYQQAPSFFPQESNDPFAASSKFGMMQYILDSLKEPLIVSAIVFLFMLPQVQEFIVNFLPVSMMSRGYISMTGLAIEALLAGAIYFLARRIIRF